MKKIFSLKTLIIIGLIIIFTGCTTAPIYNVIDHPINYQYDKSLNEDQISKAIYQAGNQLNWTMVQKKPNQIIATHIKNHHRAVVDITFDKTHYSIDYHNSSNLAYNGQGINRRYNFWVVRFSDEIRKNLKIKFNELSNK